MSAGSFELESPLSFSDGRPLTAADVVYTIRSILDGTSFRRGDLDKIERVEALGPTTVAISLSQPSASFLGNLTFGIVPEGVDDANQAAVGAGPFRVARRVGPHRPRARAVAGGSDPMDSDA